MKPQQPKNLAEIHSRPHRSSQSAAHAEMLTHARYLAAIANRDDGDYDLNEALTRACALAGFVLGFDRLARQAVAESRRPSDSDARLGHIRDLIRALLSDDHDEPFDVSMEHACELASLVQALDRDCSAGQLPRAWRELP